MRAASVLVLAIVPHPALAQDMPTFSTSVEVVYVDVFVTHDGQPVPGLKAADFDVRDNGVRQAVTLASLEQVPLVAIMVFDASGSVSGAKLEHLRAAGRAFLSTLREQDEAALLAFSHELRVVVPQGGGRAAVRRAIDGLQTAGLTSLWDALYAGIKLPVSRGRPMVVLFTDGRDNLSWLTASQVGKVAQESEAMVHVVAIVPPRDSFGPRFAASNSVEAPYIRELREVAEVTGGRLWEAGSSAQLERTFLRILAAMQARYLLSYTPAGVAHQGWHRLAVKVRNHKGAVRSRVGYMIPRTE
ncbi:MAG TPA: VWA domain-containing protein [Vicinamibacteria bacterium]|nr:VWA domain-containing protein [Vicinamibacteria bacterium]